MAKGRYPLILRTVFVDSSVLFSASFSPTGGSSKLFTVERIKLITSPIVLLEVERNVRKKLQSHHLERFFRLVRMIKIIEQKPNDILIKKAESVIAKKDAVILAEAKQAEADTLVSLDKKHFLTPSVKKFLAPQKETTPKMLIKELESSSRT